MHDVFTFDVKVFGRVHVRDFNHVDDLVDLRGTGITAFDQLKIKISGSSTIVDTGVGTIVLQRFTGTLTQDDFLL